MENYLLIKSLHILGVVLFLGNIIVTALWKTMADNTNQPVVVAFSQRLVTISDIVFTASGAALIYVTGTFFLAEPFGKISEVNWLAWGHGLFIASGILWLTVLVPIQIKQSRLANAFHAQPVIPPVYKKLSRMWAIVGTIATLLPLAVVYFMVVKPM